jgi:E3 ubiquitin-protein ligase TRIP12
MARSTSTNFARKRRGLVRRRCLHILWQGVHTIKFKKVPGPAGGSGESLEPVARSRSPTPSLSSLPEDALHAKILRLLCVLHELNFVEAEQQHHPNRSFPESAFVNNKLSAKLTRQLEEPMIVARYVRVMDILALIADMIHSQCLPNWALDLPQHLPFLFLFATRYNFLQLTSFCYARLILKCQSRENRSKTARATTTASGSPAVCNARKCASHASTYWRAR